MAMENKSNLSDIEVANRIRKLRGWVLSGKHIEKEFTFGSFSEINRFLPYMTKTIVSCNHHPDFSFNGGIKTVTIRTTTHSERGLTQADFDLAEALEAWNQQS